MPDTENDEGGRAVYFIENRPENFISGLKLMTGIEPVTSALPMRRTTDCATSASSAIKSLTETIYYNVK